MPTRTPGKIGLGLVIDPELHGRLVDAAKRDHRSMQQFCVVALEEKLARMRRKPRKSEPTWMPTGEERRTGV